MPPKKEVAVVCEVAEEVSDIFLAGDVEQVCVWICVNLDAVCVGGFCGANLARKNCLTNFQHILMSAAGSCENCGFEERSPLGLAGGGLLG